jgi:uncharacterized protein
MSLLLDLSRYRGGAERVDRRFEPDTVSVSLEDFRLVSPVVFGADVQKDAKKVRLVGRLATVLELDCGRCLEPYTLAVDVPLDLLFMPETEQEAKADVEVTDADVGVSYYKDDVIDLGDVVREQCYLLLPMKPLCREDCAGLCPTCGINRNRETCQCQATWVDPRMEALRRLRPQ